MPRSISPSSTRTSPGTPPTGTLVPRVRPGGVLLADNVLWSGEIADSSINADNIAALRAFNDKVAADDRVEVVVLTAFDGLTIARKLS